MKMSRWQTAAAVICLVAGPLGQLAQYLVTPVDEGASASAQVSAAAAHGPAMSAAVVLDVLLLLLLPAVLYAGIVAGGTRSRLAVAGTALSFVSMLGAGYLLAADVVVRSAAAQPARATAVAVVAGFENSGVVTGLTVLYLAGHVAGFILLGIALIRSRAVPAWAGAALCAWPIAEMLGEAAGIKPLAAAGFALLAVAFGACARALVQRQADGRALTMPPAAEHVRV
jgi:hypothetical protein